MVKPNVLIYLLFSLCIDRAHAQASAIRGRIYDIETHAGLPEMLIRPTTDPKPVMSDQDGHFLLYAQSGDSLIVMGAGYHTDTIMVTGNLFIEAGLRKRIIELQEVRVVAKAITPLQKLEHARRENQSIFRKGDKRDIVQISGLGLSVSVNKLYSALSKEGKDARKLQGILTRDYHAAIVDERFSSQLICRVTNLSEEEVKNFIMKYRPDYEWIESASDYDLVVYIKEKLIEFSH